MSARQTWACALAAFLILFGSTAHWYGVVNVDTMGAAWPAWSLVHHGSVHLEAVRDLPAVPWFSEVDGHIVSNRMAGVVLVGVPAQLLLLPFDAAPLTGAVLTAVVTTSLAMANLALLLHRQLGRPRLALAITAAIALGTGVWTNASAELWPHGPNLLWLTCALLLLQDRRQWLAAVALIPALWTRPHLALVAAALGVVLALDARSVRPLIRLGLPTAAGMLGLLTWNRWYFGSLSVGGGYAGKEKVLADSSAGAWHAMLESSLGSVFSPLHGLLPLSPFLALGLVAVVAGLRAAPAWARGAALGGLLYLLAQWRLNSFTGGTGLYGYRLQLEPLLLMTPAAALGYRRLRRHRAGVRSLARVLVGLSVGFHALGVYWHQPLGERGQVLDLWSTWAPAFAATYRGPEMTAVAVAAVLLCVGLALVREPLAQIERWRSRLTPITAAAPS